MTHSGPNNDTPASDDDDAHHGFRVAPGLELGDEVVAGQIIGYMGDSGNAEDSVPHLHFEFRDPNGQASPSYWSLRVAESRQACTVGIGPWSTPVLSAELEPTEAEQAVWHTIVTPLYGEGQWVIDSDGRVTATGDAALVMPSSALECAAGPATPFGTEAGGWGPVDDHTLTGTVLDGADMTGTVLDGVFAERPLPAQDLVSEPMAFTDAASGERIIVTFGLAAVTANTRPVDMERPLGPPLAAHASIRRVSRQLESSGASRRRRRPVRLNGPCSGRAFVGPLRHRHTCFLVIQGR